MIAVPVWVITLQVCLLIRSDFFFTRRSWQAGHGLVCVMLCSFMPPVVTLKYQCFINQSEPTPELLLHPRDNPGLGTLGIRREYIFKTKQKIDHIFIIFRLKDDN